MTGKFKPKEIEVPIQIKTSEELRVALKAGIATSKEYKTIKDWLEAKIREDFVDPADGISKSLIRFCNGRYEATRDGYGWKLVENYKGCDLDGNPKMQQRRTYHNNIRNVIEKMLDKEGGKSASLEEFSDLLSNAVDALVREVETL